MDTLGTALQSAEAGARVSGIAVVRWVGQRKDVRTWTGAVVAKRECEVVDATLQPTTLAVWGYDKVWLGKMMHEVIAILEGPRTGTAGRSTRTKLRESDATSPRRFFAPASRICRRNPVKRDAYSVPRIAARSQSAARFVPSAPSRPTPKRYQRRVLSNAPQLADAIWRDAEKKTPRVRLKKHAWPLLAKLARNYSSPRIGEIYKTISGEDVVDATCAARSVVGACRSVVPRAFFGSKRNERRYYRALDAFLRAGDVGGRISGRRLREVLAESHITWTHADRARRPASDLRTARSSRTFCLKC